MFDLAVSRFKTAASEIVPMDNVKKDVTYRLGLVYEKMGKREEYLLQTAFVDGVVFNQLEKFGLDFFHGFEENVPSDGGILEVKLK